MIDESLRLSQFRLQIVAFLVLLSACGNRNDLEVNSSKSSSFERSVQHDPFNFSGVLLHFDRTTSRFAGKSSASLLCDTALLTAAHVARWFAHHEVYFCSSEIVTSQKFTLEKSKSTCRKVKDYLVSRSFSLVTKNLGLVSDFMVADIAIASIQPIDTEYRQPLLMDKSSVSEAKYMTLGFGGPNITRAEKLFKVNRASVTGIADQEVWISDYGERVREGDSGGPLVEQIENNVRIVGVTSGYYLPLGKLSREVRSYFSDVSGHVAWLKAQAKNFGCDIRTTQGS